MEKFVCTGCSLLCDDVAADFSKDEPKSFGLCRLGHSIFETVLNERQDDNLGLSIDDAIKKATELLVSAQNPLLYGWTSSTNETIREGLELSATLNGFFDTPLSLGLSSVLEQNLHLEGLEIDLDGVRNEAEFVVFWGTNPAESSQRLISRFAALPKGDKIPEGVESRIIAVIDVRRTETMKIANHQFTLESNSDGTLIESIIGELSQTSPVKKAVGKISASELISFSRNLRNSDCTVFFYGSGFLNSGNYESNLTGLSDIIQLLRENGSEAYALPMTIDSNSMGSQKVSREITGFPPSIDFLSGRAEYHPQETAQNKLVSGEFDVALIVGDDSLLTLPGTVGKALSKIPMIYLGPQHHYTAEKATVSLLTSENGIYSNGTMNRMDQKKVTLMPLEGITSPFPTEFDLITKLHEHVRNVL
jgi:formylmethanofuran dehydrogenase subunit B